MCKYFYECVPLIHMHVLYSQAEELGCEGKVDESQGVMKLCDQLKAERTELEKVSQNDS